MEIGFIGLGRMGGAMARNLVKAGHKVHAWNRSPDAIRAVPGVDPVATPGDAFAADVVLTMLSDDPAIRSVVLESGALKRARAGLVHVVTSTISVAFAEELTRLHEQAGVAYVSAPVFGRPDVAEAAQLGIVAAGKASAIDKVRPVFEAIGRKTWVMGEAPKQANAAKIGGNMMIAMAIEAMAEATVIAEKNGLKATDFFDVVLGSLFGGSRVYDNYSAKLLKGDFEPGFTLKLGFKDVGLAVAAGKPVEQATPMLQALHARMSEAIAAGLGEKDWLAVADYARRKARS
ncbi:MAG TPA: NAD(P)-dependent oxidoreductase [Dongiaceae bacterium]|jgi:3-hydroxyisobutyrate dehydrogenase-like beta-hydroxyacid dehydrogenase|nr:NAD(P)-dependent oxidoreductase [Dongiaceae bacterium]